MTDREVAERVANILLGFWLEEGIPYQLEACGPTGQRLSFRAERRGGEIFVSRSYHSLGPGGWVHAFEPGVPLSLWLPAGYQLVGHPVPVDPP